MMRGDWFISKFYEGDESIVPLEEALKWEENVSVSVKEATMI